MLFLMALEALLSMVFFDELIIQSHKSWMLYVFPDMFVDLNSYMLVNSGIKHNNKHDIWSVTAMLILCCFYPFFGPTVLNIKMLVYLKYCESPV